MTGSMPLAALDREHFQMAVNLLSPGHRFTRQEALEIVDALRPEGVLDVEHLAGDPACIRLTIATMPPRFSHLPVLVDLRDALPLFAGLLFGGCLRVNPNHSPDDARARPYLKAGPSRVTVASVVMDAKFISKAVAADHNGNPLVVEPQQVVPVEAETADWWFGL